MNDPDALDVKRAQRGDTSAFSELIERNERRTYNLALRVCGDAELARDATQEAWLTAFRKLGQFRGDSAFTTWLHRVTVNASLDLLRKERRAPLLAPAEDDDATARSDPAVADHADETAGSLDAAGALARIPVEFRTALVLHDVLDLPYEEVASVLDVPIGTVRSRLHRGRIALASAIDPEGVREPRGSAGSSNP
ncbi:MAG: sigma-70 family RNA polymerase sigma factor, partial [Actinomycetota bacterium]